MSKIGKGYTGVIKVVSNPDENGNLTISQIYPKNRDVDILIWWRFYKCIYFK